MIIGMRKVGIVLGLLFLTFVEVSQGVDPANPPADMRVTVDKDGQTRTFYLERQSIRGADFELVLLDPDGVTQTTIDPGPVRTYRGWCEEEPDSYVAAMLLPNGDLRYHVFNGDVDDWWDIPAVEYDENAPPDNNFTEIGGTAYQPSGSAYPGASFTASAATLSDFYKDCYQADVGFDLLVEYVNNFNYSDWVTYGLKAESAINCYNPSTVRDMLAEHKLGKVVIRTSDTGLDRSDPRWGIDWWNINTYWESLFPSVDHHFLAFVGSVGGGVAYVCDYGGTDWAARSFNGWSSDGRWWHVWRHEAGHNWGCGDCVEGCPGPDGSTINSGNSITLSRFSNPEIDQFMSCRSGKYQYLTDLGGSYSYPVPPYANLDDQVGIYLGGMIYLDVLANDYDANGDDIAVADFMATSELGGAITFSAGTGPDDRDELIYSSPLNQFGEDHFTYAIVDETGRESRGNVIIHVDLSDTLKGYWNLDETTGTTAADASVFDNNGACQNDLTFDAGSTTGQFGGALTFDGSDDYIEIPALDLYSNTITMSAWVKWNGTQNDWAGIIFSRAYSTTAGISMRSDGRLRYHWNGTSGSYNWNSGLVVPTEQWVFVALVVEPTRATMYMHDGTMHSSVRTATHDIEEFNGVTCIGRDTNSNRYFTGSIDDVRVYNYSLDVDEIDKLVQGGPAESPNPVNNAEEVLTISFFSWAPGAAVVNHDVYLGTDYNAVLNATTASDEYQGRQSETYYTPSAMAANTEYFWRIDEVLSDESIISGAVWQFTTGESSIEPDLTVHLTFDSDDISGNTAYDSSGASVYDSTIYGATETPGGQINEALSFDGNNDYVAIPTMNLNSNTVTMSAWVKTTAVQGQFTGIAICASGNTKAGINFGWNDGGKNELAYHWPDGGSGNHWGWRSGLYVPHDDQWHHVALAVEPTKATLYLNGTSSIHAASHGADEFDDITRVGNYDGWAGRFFGGQIDDVAIWNRSLSIDEIQAIYYQGLNGQSFSDHEPPAPDPMTWKTVPTAAGPDSITMTATTAADSSGFEYYFDCTVGGGNDSGWQDSPTYVDTGLSPAPQYSYRVQARDKSAHQNETGWSSTESVTLYPQGDFEPDGDVDMVDLATFCEQFQQRILYTESAGRVTIEAENYYSRAPGSGTLEGSSWNELTGGGSEGAGYMQLLPDIGRNINADIELYAPHLSYEVDFSAGGSYYLWIKGLSFDGGSDSVHYGLNGVALSSDSSSALRVPNTGSFSWQSMLGSGARPVLTIPSADKHTIDLWMREDGAAIDRLLLTDSSSYDPSSSEPPESAHQPTDLIGDFDGDGDVDLVDYARLANNWLMGVN